VEWIESFGRVAGNLERQASATTASPVHFSFDLNAGLVYSKRTRVKVGGDRPI
jgi:hypothetical protein